MQKLSKMWCFLFTLLDLQVVAAGVAARDVAAVGAQRSSRQRFRLRIRKRCSVSDAAMFAEAY